MQKSEYMHKKDGSSVRPKSSMLEKALGELEKMVAECKSQI
jgi:ubinuclein